MTKKTKGQKTPPGFCLFCFTLGEEGKKAVKKDKNRSG